MADFIGKGFDAGIEDLPECPHDFFKARRGQKFVATTLEPNMEDFGRKKFNWGRFYTTSNSLYGKHDYEPVRGLQVKDDKRFAGYEKPTIFGGSYWHPDKIYLDQEGLPATPSTLMYMRGIVPETKRAEYWPMRLPPYIKRDPHPPVGPDIETRILNTRAHRFQREVNQDLPDKGYDRAPRPTGNNSVAYEIIRNQPNPFHDTIKHNRWGV